MKELDQYELTTNLIAALAQHNKNEYAAEVLDEENASQLAIMLNISDLIRNVETDLNQITVRTALEVARQYFNIMNCDVIERGIKVDL